MLDESSVSLHTERKQNSAYWTFEASRDGSVTDSRCDLWNKSPPITRDQHTQVLNSLECVSATTTEAKRGRNQITHKQKKKKTT